MILIDGRKAREHYITLLQERVNGLSVVPQLAIIQVGSRADSDAFIKAKKSFAMKIGAKEIHIKFSEDVSQNEVIEKIKELNADQGIQGIIVQLPLPLSLNPDIIIENIDPLKDVDGLTKNSNYIPATARGISQLLKFYSIDLFNKKVVILGRSKLVGTPIAKMCIKSGADVTVCHQQTPDIPSVTKKADIVIVAIGCPKYINSNFLSRDQIIIDVGITRIDDKGESRLVGDVDFENVKDIVKMITPVPGGVGQMTVLALFENLVDSCYNTLN